MQENKQNTPLKERIEMLVTQAKASGMMIGVQDARYLTVGHVTEVGDDYIFFGDELYELDSTGKLGDSSNAQGERALPKLLFFSALIHIELFPTIKHIK